MTNSLFTITEPTVKTKKGMTREAVIKTVKENLIKRIEEDSAVDYHYNKDANEYQHQCTVRYGVKPIKVFWANNPLENRAEREAFANAVLDYIPNLASVIWEEYKTFSKTNKRNAQKRHSQSQPQAKNLPIAT